MSNLSLSQASLSPILALSKQPLHPSLIICFRLNVLATAISGWEMLAPPKWHLVKLLISCTAALWNWYLALGGTHVLTFTYTHTYTYTQSFHLRNNDRANVYSSLFFYYTTQFTLWLTFTLGHHESSTVSGSTVKPCPVLPHAHRVDILGARPGLLDGCTSLCSGLTSVL